MMKHFLVGVLLLSSAACRGQSQPDAAAMRKEIDALKADQAAMRKELDGMKSVLQRMISEMQGKAGPEGKEISLTGLPAMGDPKASITIVEYSDYQCPFCGRYFTQTLPEVRKSLVQTGKVRYLFSNFPLDSLHPQAFKAHEAAACAGDQGKYWEMHTQLFNNQRALAVPQLESYASKIGLDMGAYKVCMAANKFANKVRSDFSAAAGLGIEGTPTFLIGKTNAGDTKMVAVKVLVGAQPFEAFRDAVDSLMGVPKPPALKDRQ